MTSANFLLTYAGVPFISDVAQNAGVQMPVAERPYGHERDQRLLNLKQQPQPDLLEEVNRLLDFGYIQDQAYPFPTRDKKTADLAKRWPINQWHNPPLKVGTYFYPHGLSRWSIFRGLMTSSMVQAVLQKTMGTGAQPFVLQAIPNSPGNFDKFTISTYLYMLPPRPLAEHGGRFDGLFLVTLVDERYYWQGATYTYHPNQASTWPALITQLSNLLGITVVTPPAAPDVYQPEIDSQLWGNEMNVPLLYDVAAHNMGGTAVRNLTGQPGFSYNIYQPWRSRQIAYQNRGAAKTVVRVAGGDIFNHGADGQTLPSQALTASINSVLPKAVRVSFPKYVIGDDPVPHFVNPRYQNPRPSCWYEDDYGDTFTWEVPLLSGGLQFSGGLLGVFISGSLQLDKNNQPYMTSGLIGTQDYALVHSTAKALYSGEIQAAPGNNPLNLSGLIPIAQQLAYDTFGQQIAVALDEVYPGIVYWQPEGMHDILWTYSDKQRGAFTRVLRAQWNVPLQEVQQATPLLSGMNHVRGVGGPSVAQTWRGSCSGGVPTGLTNGIILNSDYKSGDPSLSIFQVSFLPTQNRWKARIASGQSDDEIMLLEGTSGGISDGSGGYTVGVVLQGLDGTGPNSHKANASIIPLLQTTYGTNVVTFEKNQHIYPQEMQSGGITGVRIVPQMQTVYAYSASGALVSGVYYYSGSIGLYDPNWGEGSEFDTRESVWLVERSSIPITSGRYYGGMLGGYSPLFSGATRPVYLIDEMRHAVMAQIQNLNPDPVTGLYSGIYQTYNPVTQTWGNSQYVWLRDANQ